MVDYQVRMLKESIELEEKIDKLNSFLIKINSDEVKITDEKKDLLMKQLYNMKEYQNILTKRISLELNERSEEDGN